jgi:hypothetical protein
MVKDTAQANQGRVKPIGVLIPDLPFSQARPKGSGPEACIASIILLAICP